MSGLALFGLKYPSLLQFDQDSRADEAVKNNLQKLYGISNVPCDTTLRERLDAVDPRFLQKAINKMIGLLQRGRILEQYRYIDDYCLVAIDGSGYFSSHEVHCSSCCEKHHREGSITYYHQILAAVIVYPGYPTVFPIGLESIQKEDGMNKNDCEHNAVKRLLENLKKNHPHLKMLLVLDALYADGVIIQLCKDYDFRFIITAKSDDLKYLFEAYAVSQKEELMLKKADGGQEHYYFVNGLPINDAHNDIQPTFPRSFTQFHKLILPFGQII